MFEKGKGKLHKIVYVCSVEYFIKKFNKARTIFVEFLYGTKVAEGLLINNPLNCKLYHIENKVF